MSCQGRLWTPSLSKTRARDDRRSAERLARRLRLRRARAVPEVVAVLRVRVASGIGAIAGRPEEPEAARQTACSSTSARLDVAREGPRARRQPPSKRTSRRTARSRTSPATIVTSTTLPERTLSRRFDLLEHCLNVGLTLTGPCPRRRHPGRRPAEADVDVGPEAVYCSCRVRGVQRRRASGA